MACPLRTSQNLKLSFRERLLPLSDILLSRDNINVRIMTYILNTLAGTDLSG